MTDTPSHQEDWFSEETATFGDRLAGAREALVAGLSAEESEAEDLERALAPVRGDRTHFGALERLDRGRFAGLQAKA